MKQLDGLKLSLLILAVATVVFFRWVAVPENTQQVIFVVMLLLTGVPHGSLDYFVDQETTGPSAKRRSLKQFLLLYITCMAVYALVWFISPIISFGVFIGISAYHFGEIDWPTGKRFRYSSVLYTLYGLHVIAFVVSNNMTTAAPILESILHTTLTPAQWLTLGDKIFIWITVSLAVQATMLVLFHSRIGWSKSMMIAFGIQSAVLFFALYMLPLYLGFGFYFGLWHAALSFNLIRQQMKLANTWNAWTQLAKRSLPFTLVAWASITILIIVLIKPQDIWMLYANIFAAIAVLTLPHLVVFTKIKVSH